MTGYPDTWIDLGTVRVVPGLVAIPSAEPGDLLFNEGDGQSYVWIDHAWHALGRNDPVSGSFNYDGGLMVVSNSEPHMLDPRDGDLWYLPEFDQTLVRVGDDFVPFFFDSAPLVSVPPAINGQPTAGFVATLDLGRWNGSPLPSFTYQWILDGVDIVGATSDTYQIDPADAGRMLSVRVTGTNQIAAVSETTPEVAIQ